ncbi:hypothetical protein PENTCL1PPCAC_14403, partial [Pristionchus entomophagus]
MPKATSSSLCSDHTTPPRNEPSESFCAKTHLVEARDGNILKTERKGRFEPSALTIFASCVHRISVPSLTIVCGGTD